MCHLNIFLIIIKMGPIAEQSKSSNNLGHGRGDPGLNLNKGIFL